MDIRNGQWPVGRKGAGLCMVAHTPRPRPTAPPRSEHLAHGTTDDGQDGHKTNGRAQSTTDPVVNVNPAGMARRTLQASCVMPGKSHAASAAHLKSLTLRLPRCAQAAPSRGRGEAGENGESGGSLRAQQTKQRSPCLIPAWPPQPAPKTCVALQQRRETSQAGQTIASNLASLDCPVANRRAIARRTQGATAGNTIPGFPNNPTQGRDVELGCQVGSMPN